MKSKLKIVVTTIALSVFSLGTAYAQEATSGPISLGIAEKVSNFYGWSLGLGGLVALAIIIYGGVLYSASAGNPSRIEEAKTWIEHAIFGLILLLSSFLILNIINPDLTTLDEVFLNPNPQAGTPEIRAGEQLEALEAIERLGSTIPGIVSSLIPPGLDGTFVDGYYQLPASTDGSYARGNADRSCGSIQLVGVIYSVAQQWKTVGPGSPLVVRDLNGGPASSGVNHCTHSRGINVDIPTGGLSVGERITLGGLFVNTGIVTSILHTNDDVINGVNRNAGRTIMKTYPDHGGHFHVTIDSKFAGPCNVSCSRDTGCNSC